MSLKDAAKEVWKRFVVRAAKPVQGVPVDVIPPFAAPYTYPAQPIRTGPSEMGGKTVHSDPREGWYIFLPEKLTPKQVLQILRAALGGDLWQLWSLKSLMMSSWPMLRKCSHELRSATSRCKFVAHPYSENGKEPTKRAKEKADLVNRAMKGFRPNPFTDEKDFQGYLYDFSDAFLVGVGMCEFQWHEVNGELLPRASTWVHPRHISFDNSGEMVIVQGNVRDFRKLDPNKFFVSQFQSDSGSSLACGMIRPLAWWWSALVFNREWMFAGAQRFGNPFRTVTHKNLSGPDLDKLEASLESSGDSGWLLVPEGTVVTVTPAQSLGPDNPRRFIKAEADQEVQMLFLGQTSTTTATPGKLGGEDAGLEVRRERVEEMAAWVANGLTGQFASAVLRANYGNDYERPTVLPDFTEPESKIEAATRVAAELNTGLPLLAEEVYKDLGRKMPEPGDQTVQRGTLGVMSDVETPIQPTLDEQAQQMEMAAQFQQEPAFGKDSVPIFFKNKSVKAESNGVKKKRKELTWTRR